MMGRLVFFPISLHLKFLALLAARSSSRGPLRRDSRHARNALPDDLRRKSLNRGRVGTLTAVLLGTATGMAAMRLQQAPPSNTLPVGRAFAGSADLAALDGLARDPLPGRAVALSDGTSARVSDGRLSLADGRYVVEIEPLLSFVSRSPDRCWTNLAPPGDRLGPGRNVVGWSAGGDRVAVRYADDGDTRLVVRASETPDGRPGVEAVASTTLGRDVYSHLNTADLIFVTGHRRLWASFSPCPGERVEVVASDYPVGRPARAAALYADGVFRVVEASSGEKGPFRTLAAGPVGRENELTISLYDAAPSADGSPGDAPAAEPFAVVALPHFFAQASVAPSPTAGWGFPQNAVEFSLQGDTTDSPAAVFVSLAATSVGRGWDSVGHAAGTYSTTVRAEVVDAERR